MTGTLRDFAEPGDRYTNFTTGERYIVTEDNQPVTDQPEPEPNTLERAIWRGDALIALGADEGEPEDTQLSDVLADLMHWANHNHVDFDEAVASAQRAREAELAEWDLVLVSITNTYEDGHESEYEVWVPAPPNRKMPNEQWWEDVVFPHTGDGTGENLSAVYEATILQVSDADDTTMCGLSWEWEG